MHIVFLFYPGMTALDAIGPHEVLSRLPGAEVKRVALNEGIIDSYAGQLKLIADYQLTEVNQADILLVPGAGSATSLCQFPEILEWIKQIHQTTIWTTSVCTGSLILGAAGILNGIKATAHWAVLDRLSGWGAIPTSERVVKDGKVITAAGVSAGIDMALLLAAKMAGEEVAKTLQLGIEYDPQPPFDCGSPDKAPPKLVSNLRKRLLTRFEK